MYTHRLNQATIYRSFATPFVTAILGPRRVGKTTLISHYAKMEAYKMWAWFNMDSMEIRSRIEKNGLKALIQEEVYQQIGGEKKIWVVVDEAQKCPAIFDQIKLLYDQYKDKNAIKFILSGSSFLALHQLSAESLAGRVELYYLHEFGLKEAFAFRQGIPSTEPSFFHFLCDTFDPKSLLDYLQTQEPRKLLLEQVLTEQLLWGGMPELLPVNTNDERHKYLGNYLQTYLEKDIRAITTINDLNLYQRLIEIIAEQTGSVRQDNEMIKSLGCSRDTLKKYRGFLLATLVYREIYPFIGRSLRRLVKSPKGYLLNNGLISYLTGMDDLTLLKKTGLIGHRFENWFLKELQIWLGCQSKRHEIYYWRTSSGIEVDFVIEKKPLVFPFEVTYSTQLNAKKIKNLTQFLTNEPRAKVGFYIYQGDFQYDPQQKICFFPAWAI